MNKRIKNKNAAWLKEWHTLLKESQQALSKAEECNSFIDCKALLLFQLEEKVSQHADRACQAAEQQALPEHLTTAGAAIAEAILSRSNAALSAGNFLNRTS